jgi:hypothetical protein
MGEEGQHEKKRVRILEGAKDIGQGGLREKEGDEKKGEGERKKGPLSQKLPFE